LHNYTLQMMLLISLLFTLCSIAQSTNGHKQAVGGWNRIPFTTDGSPPKGLKRRLEKQGRIINGRNSTIAPWALALHIETVMGLEHVCGAFLVSSQPLVAVTAGHCTHFKDPLGTSIPAKMYKLHAGADRLNPRIVFKVQKVIRYPTYKYSHTEYGDFADDVAVMLLEYQSGNLTSLSTVSFQTNQDLPFAGTKQSLTVVGWGDLKTGSQMASRFKQSTHLSWTSCSFWPTTSDGKAFSTNSKDLCAVSPDSSPCQGDSGSALFSPLEQDLVYGIVSWGPIICSSGKPWVFTRIASYSDWIFAQIQLWKTPIVTRTVTACQATPESLKSQVLSKGYKCTRSCKDKNYFFASTNPVPKCLGTTTNCTWFTDAKCEVLLEGVFNVEVLNMGRVCTEKERNGNGWCRQLASNQTC
jgi:hypothetical protein